MKKLLMASALLAGLSGSAFAADDYTSANPLAGIDFSKNNNADTRGFSAGMPPGCDEAAGSETRLAACDPQRLITPGGGNSGSSSGGNSGNN